MTNHLEGRPSRELPPVTDMEKKAFRGKVSDLVRNPRSETLPSHIHPDDEIDHLWGTTYRKGNITIYLTIPVPGIKNYTYEEYKAKVSTLISTSPNRHRVKEQTLALANGQLNYKEKTLEFDDEGEELKEPNENPTEIFDLEKNLQRLREWMASPPENYRKEYEEIMGVLNTLGPEDEIRHKKS